VGVALARPDGIATIFLVIALAAVLLLAGRLSTSSYAVVAAVAILPPAVVYGVGALELGLWESVKLSGPMALALLAAAAVFAVAGGLAGRIPRLGPWLAQGHNAVRLAVVVNIVVVSVAGYRLRERFVPEVINAIGNLTESGSWGFFWFAAFGIIVLSLVFLAITRRSAWSAYLLYAIFQFFAISAMVYGLAHGGRMAWPDSFNRAALHIVPVVFWYAGTFLGSLAEEGPQDAGETA
jgi:hypothetical protein